MAIGSISPSAAAAQLQRAQSESNEVHQAGRDTSNDGDSDDKSVSQASPPKPTVNTQGQTIGTVVNTKA